MNDARWRNGRFRDEEHKQQVLAANRESYRRHKREYAARTKLRRVERKARAIAVLGEPVCSRCEQEWHPVALDFHHRDPATKRFNITSVLGEQARYSWEEIADEIRKCDLVCANCHRIEHWGDEVGVIRATVQTPSGSYDYEFDPQEGTYLEARMRSLGDIESNPHSEDDPILSVTLRPA